MADDDDNDEEAAAVDDANAIARSEGAACRGSAAKRAPENASIMSPACISRYLRGCAERGMKKRDGVLAFDMG